MKKVFFIVLSIVIVTVSVAIVRPSDLFGAFFECNGGGAAFSAVGARVPWSGSYVPVYDETVSLNTNILIYKECVLDVIVNRQKERATALMTGQAINWATQAGQGFIKDYPDYMLREVADPVAETYFDASSTKTDVLCESFRNDVKSTLKKNYARFTRHPELVYQCSGNQDKLEKMRNGDFYGGGGWSGFLEMASNPANNPIFAYYRAQDEMFAEIGRAQHQAKTELDWGQGFRSKKDDNGRITTPGYLIAQYLTQVTGSGYRLTENANEVDEIIGGLMQNFGTRMLDKSHGLTGLAQDLNAEGKTYVQDMAEEAGARLENLAYETAINHLRQVIDSESELINIMKGELVLAIETRAALREKDVACLEQIVASSTAQLQKVIEHETGTTTNITIDPPKYDTNVVEIYEPSRGNIAMRGFAKDANAKMTALFVDNMMKKTTAEHPSIGALNMWEISEGIDLKELAPSKLPEGTIATQSAIIKPLARENSGFPVQVPTFTKYLTTEGAIYELPVTASKRGYVYPGVTISGRGRQALGGNVSHQIHINLIKRYSFARAEGAGKEYLSTKALVERSQAIGNRILFVKEIQAILDSLNTQPDNDLLRMANRKVRQFYSVGGTGKTIPMQQVEARILRWRNQSAARKAAIRALASQSEAVPARTPALLTPNGEFYCVHKSTE